MGMEREEWSQGKGDSRQVRNSTGPPGMGEGMRGLPMGLEEYGNQYPRREKED